MRGGKSSLGGLTVIDDGSYANTRGSKFLLAYELAVIVKVE
jgi:hypothetical protein